MRRFVVLLVLLLLGCSTGTAAHGPGTSPPLLQVSADVPVPHAGNLVVTPRLLWVLGGPSGEISAIDPATNEVVREVTLPHPAPYGSYAGGALWISSFADDVVMQVDATTGRVISTVVPSGRAPIREPVGAIILGHELWVVSHQPAWLSRFDARTGRALGATRLPGDNAGGPDLVDGRLWVWLARQGRVLRFDARTGHRVGRSITIPTGMCTAISRVGPSFWVTSQRFGGFACRPGTSRVDTSGQVAEVHMSADHPLYSFASLGQELWADDLGNDLFRVDDGDGSLTPVLGFEGRTEPSPLVSAFGSLWVGGDNGSVLRLDLP